MTDDVKNVLFLCTGNSARSVLAEALMERLGGGKFKSFSAGSQPKGQVHPQSLALLKDKGYDVTGFRSKSWDEFAGGDAPQMDIIFTVCDSAAGETCPIWPGHPTQVHWGFEDPAAATGTDEEVRAVFEKVYGQIEERLKFLVSVSEENLDSLTLKRRLQAAADFGFKEAGE